VGTVGVESALTLRACRERVDIQLMGDTGVHLEVEFAGDFVFPELG
jgi:hypothetical protein